MNSASHWFYHAGVENCFLLVVHAVCDHILWKVAVAYQGILFGWGSTNSVEDRGQKERGSGGGSPLVRGST
jgi:hypothetical protein